jgi:predicted metal-dependent enzyme (double-stranded beta helix superfamily)
MGSIATLDGPVRGFFERLETLAGTVPDMGRIPALLVELSRDGDYFAHHIAAAPENGSLPIYAPEHGPRLTLVHRPEGTVGAVHSHSVWVALAPITGTETHRRYDVLERRNDGQAKLALAEERHLDGGSGAAATLTPPNDVHAHGHVEGIGEPAYVLILAGDNQVLYERQEYDLRAETWRTLAPGDRGHWNQQD